MILDSGGSLGAVVIFRSWAPEDQGHGARRLRGWFMSTPEKVDLQAALRQVESWQGESVCRRLRRFPRYAARGEARLCSAEVHADQTSFDHVHVRDISRGGIGVLMSRPLTVGQCWQIQLIAQRITMATLPAFCRFCRKITDNAWLVGLEFGIEASVLLAMGVNAGELSEADETPETSTLSGDFLPPDELAAQDAA
jgi:hypothetical protein